MVLKIEWNILYSVLLINAIEKGSGIFPLIQKKFIILFKVDISKLKLTKKSYFFRSNENIKG